VSAFAVAIGGKADMTRTLPGPGASHHPSPDYPIGSETDLKPTSFLSEKVAVRHNRLHAHAIVSRTHSIHVTRR
jgi:hypothetical protein